MAILLHLRAHYDRHDIFAVAELIYGASAGCYAAAFFLSSVRGRDRVHRGDVDRLARRSR